MRTRLTIRAEQASSSSAAKKVVTPMTDLRKKLEKQRTATIRENMNKLAVIAGADVRFMYDALLELDTVHKKLFDYKEVTKAEDDENVFMKKEGETQ